MTHDLTPTQQQAVKQLVDTASDLQRQHAEMQQRLNWFLSYVVAENQLPDLNYSLSDDGTQLIGTETQADG